MNEPLTKFRAGAVVCAIWENRVTRGDQPAVILKATVERRYRDANGAWRSTGSFSRNELPLVRHVLDQAFTWMIDRELSDGQRPWQVNHAPPPSAGGAPGGDARGADGVPTGHPTVPASMLDQVVRSLGPDG